MKKFKEFIFQNYHHECQKSRKCKINIFKKILSISKMEFEKKSTRSKMSKIL